MERKTYKIGQAAKLLDVKPFVLRFWEGEFKGLLVPVRTPSGQRAYTDQNVETVREIKRLLYDEGLTIEGARKRLREAASHGPVFGAAAFAAPVGPGDTAAVVASAPAASAAAPRRSAQPSLLDPPPDPARPPQQTASPVSAQSAAPSAPAADPHALRRAEDKAQALHAALADVLSELRSLRDLLG